MPLGADTHTYQRTNKNDFKKPGARGLQLRVPGLKISDIIHSNFLLLVKYCKVPQHLQSLISSFSVMHQAVSISFLTATLTDL